MKTEWLKGNSRKYIRTGLWVLGVLMAAFLLCFAVLKWAVLRPEKLTPLVISNVNKAIDGKLSCKSIELTLFETFPHIGVALTDGVLVSGVTPDSVLTESGALIAGQDSLIAFQKCIVSLRPLDYLFGGKITLGEVTIQRPVIRTFIDELGKGNWEIVQTEADSATQKDTELPPIEIKRIEISDAEFTFRDVRKDIFCKIEKFFFASEGSLVKGATKFDIKSKSESLLFESPQYTLTNHMRLALAGQVAFSNNYNRIALKGASLMVNNLPFDADGWVERSPDGESMQMDMEMGFTVTDLNEVIPYIPDAYLKNKDQIRARGKVILEGSVRGTLDNRQYPSAALCCKIENGAYRMKDSESGIDTLNLDVDLMVNGLHPDSSYLSVENSLIKGLSTSLELSGKVTDLLSNPKVDARMKGSVDFTRLAKEFLNTDSLLLEGAVSSDIRLSFTQQDILSGQFGRIKTDGGLKIKNFKAYSEPLGMDVFISDAVLAMDRDTATVLPKGSKGIGALQATLSMDSLQFKYKDLANTNISKLKLQARTTPERDTAAVIPLGGTLEFDRLQTLMPDSVWVIARHSVLKGGMRASADDKKVPVARLSFSLDSLQYFIPQIRTAVMLDNSSFTVEALPYKSVRNQRASAGLSARGDSLRNSPSARRFTASGDSAKRTNNDNSILRKWEVRGNVVFQKMRLLSRLFPLPVEMNNSNVSFTTNTVKLDGARLQAGKSDLKLSGEITSIRRALLRGGKLKGKLAIESDYIDCNELIQAINAGVLFSEENEKSRHSVQADDNPEVFDEALMHKELTATQTDTAGLLLVIPSYLDLSLHTRAKEIVFNNLNLNEVTGTVVMRDQRIQLTDLTMHSNMGEGKLSMIYTATDKHRGSTGFDLDVKQILVDKLISLFPSIDTLLPMLRSFEGVVDCQMAASCELDSTLMVKLPTLRASCSLQGKNMVLLDGETFTEISKKLMFKNKNRNMIDSISVDMVVKDNKMEVFPFIIQMDRYKVAVGGTQQMDMSFNYHISVLKSPVPFKLGIDIKGTPEKFNYDITKCRYKDLFSPSKTNRLDTVKINVRKQIYDSVRKQMNLLSSEPESIRPSGNLALEQVAEKPEE
ncbi:MAG: AsmA-like C-terminal region-containing protein [Macellibacteroides sp.]|uniref:AsmA-like C-terminal region-containing protein n=1 Tax=Macellibacteroides sp. TaxID=2014584 RepID=UPI003E78F268